MSLESARITNGGTILHDRAFAIFDSNGQFVNGKANAMVHLLRSYIDFENQTLSLRHHNEPEWQTFDLIHERQKIDHFLSSFFGENVNMQQNLNGRFMDIPDTSCVTVVSTASLESVANWFASMHLDETRKRFRATLEISGEVAFWEDNLFSGQGSVVEFTIGDVSVFGMSPRARCIVPTRNSESGEITHGFPKIFARHRLDNLPETSHLKEYGHGYYLTVDCHIPNSELGKSFQLGDELRIVGERTSA